MSRTIFAFLFTALVCSVICVASMNSDPTNFDIMNFNIDALTSEDFWISVYATFFVFVGISVIGLLANGREEEF